MVMEPRRQGLRSGGKSEGYDLVETAQRRFIGDAVDVAIALSVKMHVIGGDLRKHRDIRAEGDDAARELAQRFAIYRRIEIHRESLHQALRSALQIHHGSFLEL